MHLARLFPEEQAKTVADFGMLGALDPAVMAKAEEERRILVTSNRETYRTCSWRTLQGGKRKCTDMFGLVLFSGEISAQLRIPVRVLESHLRLDGKPIKWMDVQEQNLLVRVTAGARPRVERLPRCPYCVTLKTS